LLKPRSYVVYIRMENNARRVEAAGRAIVEVRRIRGVLYQLEFVRCGKCRHCIAAPVHGPYWYRYAWKKGKRPNAGRMVSTYVGRELE
jgi:hypothetical protein